MIVAALLVLLIGASEASAATKTRVPCPSGKSLSSSPAAYAFQVRGALYGCVRGARLARPIQRRSDEFGGSAWGSPIVVGHWLVYNGIAFGKCGDYYVSLVDLRSGVRWHDLIPSGTIGRMSWANGCYDNGEPLTAAVVRDDGALAFIVGPGDEPGTRDYPPIVETYQVMLSDWSGLRSVAIGRDVDPHHLTLDGDTVIWRQAGEEHVATLAPIDRPPR
jgi:hypothetical protein